MKKNLGFVLVIISLSYETLYAIISYLSLLMRSPVLIGLLQYLYSPFMNVVTVIFRLVLIAGVVILINKRSMIKRIVIALIMFLLMMPSILFLSFDTNIVSWGTSLFLLYLSSIVAFICLLHESKELRYLAVSIQFVLLIVLEMVFRMTMSSHVITFYAVMKIIMPIGILFAFVFGNRLNFISRIRMTEDNEKKQMIMQRIKKTSIAIILLLIVITIQAVVRTQSYDVIFDAHEVAEYERYSNEALYLDIKTSPILFNLYYLNGEIVIGEDEYKVNRFVIMKSSKDYKDYVHFDFRSNIKLENEKIKLDIKVNGDKDEVFGHIFVYMISDNNNNDTRHQESLTYRLRR